MKRLLLAILAFSTLCIAHAQVWDVLDIVKADRQKASACEGPYRFDAPALTPSPKGYRPYYISLYARHGSRYAYDSGTYTRPLGQLLRAADASLLTPRGEQLMKDYLDFCEEPITNTGDLVALGFEQHQRIAEQMYDAFPKVFRSDRRAVAHGSTTPRAIVSMGAFCLGLQKKAPHLTITEDSYHIYLPVTATRGAPRALLEDREGLPGLPGGETLRHFQERTFDYEGILGRLFTDASFMTKDEQTDLIRDLYFIWGGYHNYCDSDFLEDLFTPEQIASLWEADNYDRYTDHSLHRYDHLVLVNDIVAKADEALAGGDVCCDMRFGHDHVLNALYPLLNLGGSGALPVGADDVKYWFQTYNTPMASNIQFVLYTRRHGSGDVLFKVLHNGTETTLPQLTPVTGPYYRWEDFKAWVAAMNEAHPVKKNKE